MKIINTKTEEEFDRLMKYFEEKKIVWCDDEKAIAGGNWETYKEQTCMKVNGSLTFADVDYYKRGEVPIQTVNEYIRENQTTKFKVGDKVRVKEGLKGEKTYGIYFNNDMKKLMGETLTIRNIDEDVYNVEENCWDWIDEMLEKVEEDNKINSKEEINKSNTKKMSIVKFAKNLTLSKDEKLLREQGLRDECGEWTDEADVIVANLVADDKRKDLIDIAQKMKDETKK